MIPSNPFGGSRGGQPSSDGQPQSFGLYQASAIGQFSPQGNTFFGQPTTPVTTVTGGNQTTVFEQPLSEGVSSVLGQTAVKRRTVFGNPSSTSVTCAFPSSGVAENKGFTSSNFSFKPVNESLFKPIFGAGPETQSSAVPDSAFSTNEFQTSSSTLKSNSTSTNFFSLTGAKSMPVDFNFSQPSLAPSAQSNPLTTGNSSTNVQFTFSQPLLLSSTTSLTSTTQPTTPSSFSFSVKPSKPQTTTVLKGTSFEQSSLFGGTKINADANTDEKGQNLEDTNLFPSFSRGTKRKEGTVVSSTVLEKSTTNEGVPAEGDSLARLTKRPLMRPRGPLGGIFSRALNDLGRDGNNPGRYQVTKGTSQQLAVREQEREQVQVQSIASDTSPEDLPQQSMDQLQRSEGSDSRTSLHPDAETKSPLNSTGSPTDCNIILCKNVPANLNRKDIIEKHFGRFGKVRKVFCRPAKNMATVHFNDHAAAAQAKKRGKVLHNKELLLLWQRKKQSPSDNWRRPATGTEEAKVGSEGDSKSKASSSPYKTIPFSSSPVRSAATLSQSMPVKRSLMAKSQQFNTEPQKESTTESQSLECPVPSSFSYLIGQVAETAEEKYRLLEQRDKILRQSRPKRTDLDMSKVFVGTCPDMCPEKERFMRETRKQLSVFEVIPDTEMVDHTAAVKEYSRSSADQEEPLPHELRPLPVLCMTMNYLVTQIMDQVNENYRDWYDFVWNRTRGIRKDITQQHLCCPDTVSLIEKCTRFHIHCAHHLCEEHISAFDAKINNENMTKCLQSLKEMYQDLATHQVYCCREAEFRQYSVLLRLNDGDILREVQQFREEVRNSPEVKLAVQAFAAVNSNNFVRFFKLVKRASYLVSCLLHRYFNQVRAKALQTLNLAHTVGPRSTAFPLEDIVRMLMFNSSTEAIDFIHHHGLIINDTFVEMSRISYQQPDLPLSPNKSDIILAKKNALVGEVVNGGPLPSPPQHNPVCSFDSQNKYRGEALVAEATTGQFKAADPKLEVRIVDTSAVFGQPAGMKDQITELTEPYHMLDESTESQQLFLPISHPQPVKPPSPKPVYHNEDIASVLECVIDEVVAEAVTEVAHDGVRYVTTAIVESSVHTESVLSEVMGQLLKEISSEEIEKERLRVTEEKQKLEEASRRRQEHEAFLMNFSHSLCTTLVLEVLDETLKAIAISEIQKAVDEKAQFVAKCTEQICATIVEETLNADITALVEDILEAKLQCIRKYIDRWRKVVALRQQLKRQMRVFPAAPCFVDPLRKQRALVPSAPLEPCIEELAHGVVHLGNAGTLAISSTRLLKLRKEVFQQMRVHFYYQQLLDEAVWLPLNLPQLVVENTSKAGDHIFWKAVLLLPSYHDSVSNLSDRILSEWLETKFGGSQEPSDGTLRTIHFANTIQEKEQCLHRVHISIKALRGPLNEQGMSKMESFEFQGTRALIMLLPSTSIEETEENESDVPLLSALLQLKQFQQASTCQGPLPLVILIPGSDTGITQKLEEALLLQELVQEDLISEYKFFFIPESTCDLRGCGELKQVMRWLIARAPPAIPLSCQTLQQLVEVTLNHEFISKVFIEHQKRMAAQLPSVHPAPVISLYNAVLTHIANNVTPPEMGTLPPCEFWQPESPEFVPYLGWNFVHHQAWIRKAILSLQLPQWDSLSVTDSWTELCSSVFSYAAQVPLTGHSQPLLMSRLKNLLERVRVKGKLIPGNMCSDVTWIPWDNIVLVCIDQKLRDWQIPGPPHYEDALTDNGEILVYFHAESLNGFKSPEEWTQVVRQTHKEKLQESQEMGSVACAVPSRLSFGQEAFHSLVELAETSTAFLDTHTPTAQELLGHRVLQSLDEERRESQRCTDQLQRWLDSDPLEHISTLFPPSHTLGSTTLSTTYTPAAKTRDATIP
ncbi:germinal-center associated nuclear protein isoform X1 [Takifugu flavidus]|uniref:germinal-center associated nuclear protein isoform X1 n=1 Tax=Takifugu flavidus TaxID=433684 RepID=UPI0025440F74|nr:germinal-center associated nuclear protein isoform X1 [Takifugu flavidus]XP_056884187.1 germinal-center associated nuclear protein isoform X1 [Takifugu flavidus]